MNSRSAALVVAFYLCCFSVFGLEEGENCSYSIGVPGKCSKVFHCKQALIDIKEFDKPFVVCSTSSEGVQIVCCPNDEEVTEAPTIHTRSRDGNSRLAHQKCVEYSELVYEITIIPSLLPRGTPLTNKISRCGFKVVPLIVGGTAAKPQEFPHMARLGYGNISSIYWSCGGSVISRRFILTAGHCVITRDGPPTFVRVGDLVWDTDDDVSRPQTLTVASILPYPAYNRTFQYDDIALLRLTEDIEFNFFVRPACLHTEYAYSQQQAIATGWGATEFLGIQSGSLLKVTLDLFTFDECSPNYAPNRQIPMGLLDSQQLCAGSKNGTNKDTCGGDSGGPLQVFHDLHCMYSIVGVTSFGKGCGGSLVYGVYARVSNYVDWIEDNAFAYG